jgi:hypothetical protein
MPFIPVPPRPAREAARPGAAGRGLARLHDREHVPGREESHGHPVVEDVDEQDPVRMAQVD